MSTTESEVVGSGERDECQPEVVSPIGSYLNPSLWGLEHGDKKSWLTPCSSGWHDKHSSDCVVALELSCDRDDKGYELSSDMGLCV